MIIVSNGFSHFHLKAAAAEIHRHGDLEILLTGVYPTKFIQAMLKIAGLSQHRKIARLLAREEASLEGKVNSVFLPEVLALLGVVLRQFENFGLKKFNDWIIRQAFKWYGNWAARLIANNHSTAHLYHYRAGYGGRSVQVAKKLGMVTLCDHSIIHPDLLGYFIDNQGQWPEPGHSGKIDLLWRYIKQDIEQADHVVVNSDFVKKSFLHMGWDADVVHALYWGIDDDFVKSLPSNDVVTDVKSDVPTFVFAGSFGARKGADVLVAAFSQINDLPWRLELYGPVEGSLKTKYKEFFADERVEHGGNLSREELAKKLMAAGRFIFPTFAEGSARVLFEALACGCYVITTPNCGSIAEDKIQGAIVPPGDVEATVSAIRNAIQNPDLVQEIGRRNADLISSTYLQSFYGNKLVALYEKIAD